MKKCPYCGAEYPDDAVICAIDHTPLDPPGREAPQPPPLPKVRIPPKPEPPVFHKPIPYAFIFWVTIGLLVALVVGFYLEEDWRGERAWEQCKNELKAKGESVEWKDYIPPTVPDDQNIFKAPHMADWFIKHRSGTAAPDEPSVRMNLAGFGREFSNSVTLAEVTLMPATFTNSPGTDVKNDAIVLRYISHGPAAFWKNQPRHELPRAAELPPVSSRDARVPLIQFSDVPITTAIENLARQAAINYMLDPKIGFGLPDENGKIRREPLLNIRWENVSCRQALLAILDDYDLRLIDDPKAGIARITLNYVERQPPAVASMWPASTNDVVGSLIQFSDVPLTTAIENLARQGGIKYSLDPNIGYGKRDKNGKIKTEPELSIRWENISARDALVALLDNYGLQLIYDPKTGTGIITEKDPPILTQRAEIPLAREFPWPTPTNGAGVDAPGRDLPLIQFDDVPITTAIENLARQDGLNYILDPKIGYGEPDEEGNYKVEPVLSFRWENVTAGEALLAVLNESGLQLDYNPETEIAKITPKSKGARSVYISATERTALAARFEQAIGKSVVGSQAMALLAGALSQVKPVQVTLSSEAKPTDQELIALFKELYPNGSTHPGSPSLHVERVDDGHLRVTMDAASATDFLKWSDAFQGDFDLIREALKRPYARMDGDYSNPFRMPIPNYVNIRIVVETLAQRAEGELLLGRPDKALTEVTLLNDMQRLMEAAPTGEPMPLVSAMINVAVTGLYTDTIANGIRLHAWREPELVALQSQLAKINLAPDLVRALKEDTQIPIYLVEHAHDSNSNMLKDLRCSWMPGGWLYQNLVLISENNHEVAASWDAVRCIFLPGKIAESQRIMDDITRKGFRPYSFLTTAMTSSYSKAVQATACNQVRAWEGQVACALERCRLKHGAYPGSTDVLVPGFIEKLPHDIIGGGRLKYHRTDAGTFLLYSIGWNETDDGGLVGLNESGVEDPKAGDWVWKD